MLRELYIKDFGIFDEDRIHFTDGMTTFSGETGAGKSLVVGAIALILGARASLEDVRSGCDEAIIEAVFEPYLTAPLKQILDELAIDYSDGQLIIRRVLHVSGRSKVIVNDVSLTVAGLTRIGPHLIDLSGQHQHQVLLDSSCHLSILDQYAGESKLIDEYQQAFAQLRGLAGRYSELVKLQQSADERCDFLKYRVRELEDLNLKPGEDDELKASVLRMQNSVKLFEVATSINQFLANDEESINDRLSQLRKQLESARDLDPTVASWADELEKVCLSLDDIAIAATDYAQSLDFDPAKRDQIEARLLKLSEVVRKYGSVDQALNELEEMRRELGSIENVEADLEHLEGEMVVLKDTVKNVGSKLSKKRRQASSKLSKQIQKELVELAMEGSQFAAEFKPVARSSDAIDLGTELFASRSGLEDIVFMFSANRGENLKPLNKVASGGELSRVMLAIKLILSGDGADTFIFDEIDNGVGGRQAEVIGLKLKTLAQSSVKQGVKRQVFCVTHLAPIASFGDQHLLIKKSQQKQRTVAKTYALDRKPRLEEIARMLSGANITAKTLASAEEMLKNAQVSSSGQVRPFDQPASI